MERGEGAPLRPEHPTTTLKILFGFWLPLAVMWIIMGIEQPSLNGIIARLPNAAVHLAAFEVAFGLALVIESPIIQMLSAGTALVLGRRSYRSMARFMHVWAVLLTSIHLITSREIVFSWITGSVLGVPADVRGPAQTVFSILIPFAALVGYRRLWQGALIRAGKTKLVARTMVIRLIATIGGLATGLVWHRISPDTSFPGHVVGGLSLMLGIVVGAAAAWWYFRTQVLHDLAEGPQDVVKAPKELLAFYIPLSLTSIMTLVSRPVLAFGISRSVQPFLSLAAWPVVQSLMFLFTSIALSYQEAVVAKMGETRENEEVLRRFGLLLGGTLTILFFILGYTGGSAIWFDRIAGLTPELIELARPAMMILVLMPFLVTGRSYFSGILVSRDRTDLLGMSVAANTVVLVTLVMVLPRFTEIAGASVAAIAFAGANTAQLTVLIFGDSRVRRRRRLDAAVSAGVARR
ncbi:MAG: hypothetical protein WD492_14795 [Alkalispirochaeta sp.]